jgi:FkbM family methyltransferase
MIPRFLTKAVKDLAYRFGVEVRRAHPMPKSGRVPSFYDPFHEQRRMLADVAKPVLFDVGAHEGLTTLQYKELFPGARVYAFEPFEGSFQKLRAATGNVPGVHLVNQALGRTRGELKFRVNQSTATNSLLPTDPRARETWNGMDVTDTVAETVVQVDTLDHFLEANDGIGRIDVLKLDAQGGEMDILLGAEKSIGQGRVRILYTEIIVMPTYTGQRSLDEYLAFMRGHGFVLHNLYNPLFSNSGQLNQVDALFVHPDLVHVD